MALPVCVFRLFLKGKGAKIVHPFKEILDMLLKDICGSIQILDHFSFFTGENYKFFQKFSSSVCSFLWIFPMPVAGAAAAGRPTYFNLADLGNNSSILGEIYEYAPIF
jgi:hypothetical protein